MPTSQVTLDASSLADKWKRSSNHSYWLPSDLEALQNKPRLLQLLPLAPVPQDDSVAGRFGRRLRTLRKNCGLTQMSMAMQFGIDRSYISDIEHGKKSISLPMLEVLARGFGLSLAELFRDL